MNASHGQNDKHGRVFSVTEMSLFNVKKHIKIGVNGIKPFKAVKFFWQ
jgi:hypothetical protein